MTTSQESSGSIEILNITHVVPHRTVADTLVVIELVTADTHLAAKVIIRRSRHDSCERYTDTRPRQTSRDQEVRQKDSGDCYEDRSRGNRSDRRSGEPRRHDKARRGRSPSPFRKPCSVCRSREHSLDKCPKVTCYNCDDIGHVSYDCPMPRRRNIQLSQSEFSD